MEGTVRMTTRVIVFALVMLLYTPSSDGAKILLLPLVGTSHTDTFGQLGLALLDKGHQVHAVVNGDCESINHLRNAKVELISYNNTLGGCLMENPRIKFTVELAMEFTEMSWIQIINAFSSLGPLLQTETRALLGDEKLARRLKKMDFDAIVVDGIIFNRFAYVLAYRLQKPIISLQTIFNPFEAGIPALPSIYPSKQGLYAKYLTFTDRMESILRTISYFYILPWLSSSSMNKLVSEYAPEMPYLPISSIAARTKLWLIVNDDILGLPTVTSPNVVQVGGLNTKPSQPLTGKVKEIADGAREGLIIVNFGADISLPPRVKKMVLLALGQLKHTVIMKSNDEPIKGLPKNVHMLPRIPQNDLLGHPNTKLLITHCNSESLFEALYHAVPIIGMPVFGDQMHYAYNMAQHGMGIAINTKTFTSEELLKSMNEVITNGSYKDNCMKMSDLFRSRPMTAMQKATYWVEHVVKYGGHDLQPAGMELGFFQFWCLDLALFALVLSLILIYITIKILKGIVLGCCSRRKPIPQETRPKRD